MEKTAFKTPISFMDLLAGDNDPLGLLANVEPAKEKKAQARTPAEANFLEIASFYEAVGRLPELNAKDIKEKMLAARLQAYRSRAPLKAQVKHLDVHGLLEPGKASAGAAEGAKSSFSSLEDIFKSDQSGLLSNIDSSILKIEHVTEQSAEGRHWPDEIASRKPCEDFFKFEKLFTDTQRDIVNRKVETVRFKNETQLAVGDFFILSGLLCLVDRVIDEGTTATRNKENPRLRVIFENGIETNILKLSLARALYKDPHGRRVIPDADTVANTMVGITHHDKATGCIYILASETKAPALASLKLQGRLVKIGYSSQSVQERIKNAENDPTYLEAPVKVLATLDCYNLNPQKVEHLIHAFLAKQRVNMTLISSKGLPYKPTEWFAVDLETAVAVAEHIVKGDIIHYRMDNTTGKIRKIALGSLSPTPL